MVIKAVIFDMNGVIIDDEHLHELAFKKVCKGYGIELSSDDYRKLCMGRTDKAGFEDIIKKFNLKGANISKLMEKKSNAYLTLIPGNIKSLLGAVELIRKLSRSFRLALTSSSTLAEIEMVVNYFKVKDFFEVIVSAEDVKKGKPDPEPYLITAKKLEVSPQKCMVIEDSENGVLSAKRADMFCIGFHNEISDNNLSEADLEVNSLTEISADVVKNIQKK